MKAVLGLRGRMFGLIEDLLIHEPLLLIHACHNVLFARVFYLFLQEVLVVLQFLVQTILLPLLNPIIFGSVLSPHLGLLLNHIMVQTLPDFSFFNLLVEDGLHHAFVLFSLVFLPQLHRLMNFALPLQELVFVLQSHLFLLREFCEFLVHLSVFG